MSDQYFEQAATPAQGQPVRYAGWWQRVGGSILDVLICLIPLIIVSMVLSLMLLGLFVGDSENNAGFAYRAGTFSFSSLLGVIAYAAVFGPYDVLTHSKRQGQTIGKSAVSIRLVDANTGQVPATGAIATRVGFKVGLRIVGIIPFVGWIMLPIALLDWLWPLWDPRKQTLHDKIANTVVVEA